LPKTTMLFPAKKSVPLMKRKNLQGVL